MNSYVSPIYSIAGTDSEFTLLAPVTQNFEDKNTGARMKRLLKLCTDAGVPKYTIVQRAKPTKPRIHAIVAGKYTKEQLLELCQALRYRFTTVFLVIDAVELTEYLEQEVFSQLEQDGIQLILTESIGFLFNRPNRFIYAYPKSDVSCSVAVIFQASRKVILVRRAVEPFKGMYSLPGGFHKPLLEDLPSCISRELFEETGLKLPEKMFRLVDVRSRVDRDNRGHVIDHGYLCEIPPSLEKRLPAKLVVRDDIGEVKIVTLSQALRTPLAGDHRELLIAAKNMTVSVKLPSIFASLKRIWSLSRTQEAFSRY